MKTRKTCLICSAPVTLMRMRGRAGTNVIFKNWRVALVNPDAASALCDAHFLTWISSPHAQAFLYMGTGVERVGLTRRGFERVARLVGMRPRALKKRLVRARPKKKLRQHDWAIRQAWFDNNPWLALVLGCSGILVSVVHGLALTRRAA